MTHSSPCRSCRPRCRPSKASYVAVLTQLLYITPMRYLLGLSDLTGELMRFAINSVASPNASSIIARVVGMQRAIYEALEPLAPFQAEIRKKQQVSFTSLRKVEDGTCVC